MTYYMIQKADHSFVLRPAKKSSIECDSGGRSGGQPVESEEENSSTCQSVKDGCTFNIELDEASSFPWISTDESFSFQSTSNNFGSSTISRISSSVFSSTSLSITDDEDSIYFEKRCYSSSNPDSNISFREIFDSHENDEPSGSNTKRRNALSDSVDPLTDFATEAESPEKPKEIDEYFEMLKKQHDYWSRQYPASNFNTSVHPSSINSIETLSSHGKNVTLFFEGISNDNKCVLFRIDNNLNDIIQCRINVESSIEKSSWWLQNKFLFQGREDILLPSVNEFIKTVKPEFSIDLNDLQVVVQEGVYLITINLLHTEKDADVFEEILLKRCVPEFDQDRIMNAYLRRVERNGDLYLELDTSLASRIRELLKNPISNNLIDDRDEMHRKLYELYYRDYNVKEFLAPVYNNWSEIHRVKILGVVQEHDDGQEQILEVSYLDLGFVDFSTMNKMACMTRKSCFPPILQKLPPQLFKAHFYDIGDSLSSAYEHLGILNKEVQVKLIETPSWANRNMHLVELYMENLERIPDPSERRNPNCSLNEYLLWIDNQEGDWFTKRPKVKATQEKLDKLHNLYKEIATEQDSLRFRDKMYEPFNNNYYPS